MSLPFLDFLPKPGALPSPPDPRTLRLSDYLSFSKLNVPPAVDWTLKKTTPWGMMDNWELNDCTCAAAGHMIECWTANASQEILVDDAAVLQAYSAVSGYNPITKENNVPICYLDVLRYWRTTGIGGHRIKAFTSVSPSRADLVRATIFLFGGGYAGLNLPRSIQGQTLWQVRPGGLVGDNAPGSHGGHAVTLLAYDGQGLTSLPTARSSA